MRIMISGGGTGGHIFPALAIADAIRTLQPTTEFLFVGAKGRMEMEKVPAAGYSIRGLWISGLDRQRPLRNITFPFKLISSIWTAYRLIREFRPDVVVGVGGFASGPLVEVASRLGIPVLIQEQNSYAGLTNKILARKADRICVAFEGMESYFPKEKIRLTGNPIRQNLCANVRSRNSAKEELGIAVEKKVVLSLGGSLGARTLNRMFAENTKQIEAQQGIHFIWQYGSLYSEAYGQSITASLTNVTAMPFIDRMDLMYAAADLVVARAGALTLTELAALGKAALLIPSPNVAEDHQTKNAMKLIQGNAAVFLADDQAVDTGIDVMATLVNQPEKLKKLEDNIRLFFHPDAARHIAEEVIKLAKAS